MCGHEMRSPTDVWSRLYLCVVTRASNLSHHPFSRPGIARQSFFSPPFSAGGIRNLQIELSVKFGTPFGPPRDFTHIGEACVYLWAPKGTHASFRLYMNERVGRGGWWT